VVVSGPWPPRSAPSPRILRCAVTGIRLLLILSTPIDDETSYFTFVVWRRDDFSVAADEVTRLDRMIGAEDRRLREQLRGPLPLDATTLVNVQADRPSVEWRRRLRELLTT